MPEQPAIQFRDVSKIYRLFGSQRDQLIHVLGLDRIGLRTKSPVREFPALKGINLDVPRGHRIGVVGRNGAGKTTLLKLVSGNFSPTTGSVSVTGMVQALMTSGAGFHPEYTGRENVLGALQYNGLSRSEYASALEGIVEFCELGEFLDQPFKTYSLGMQARLMFATATAIKPDILIVDEILGAGDAYFVAKSKNRVAKLVQSGCTMLLVSHSMSQVLELCDEAIWLEAGEIRMRGSAFEVVKAYEAFMQSRVSGGLPPGDDTGRNADGGPAGVAAEAPEVSVSMSQPQPQEPSMETGVASFAFAPIARTFHRQFVGVAPGGISRWPGVAGVKVCGFAPSNEGGVSTVLAALRPCRFSLMVEAEHAGHFRLRYGFVVDDPLGRSAMRIYSPCDEFDATEGSLRIVEALFNPLQLGPGEYTVGVSVLEYSNLESINHARRYDLLGRSFRIEVRLPDSLSAINASALLAGQWRFGSA